MTIDKRENNIHPHQTNDSNIGSVVKNWQRTGMASAYFRGHPEIRLATEDYLFQGNCSKDYVVPKGLFFLKENFDYNIVLQATSKKGLVSAAILGFNHIWIESENAKPKEIFECGFLKGKHKGYRELSPVNWYGALLGELVDLGKESDIDEVHVTSVSAINELTREESARFVKLYDDNANNQGFTYLQEINRYVLILDSKR